MHRHLRLTLAGILTFVVLSACIRLPSPPATTRTPTLNTAAPTATLAASQIEAEPLTKGETPTTQFLTPSPTARKEAEPTSTKPPAPPTAPPTATAAAIAGEPAETDSDRIDCTVPTDDYRAQLGALLDHIQAQNLPPTVVQVDLARHAKISQYDPEITAAYGFNACGLVAAGAALGGRDWVPAAAQIRTASGDAYTAESGIQPSPYVDALRRIVGSESVREENGWTLCALAQALLQDEIVIVDIQVGSRLNEPPEWPNTTPPNYAHFARVLGLDLDLQRIYIENTLRGEASYWELSLAEFWDVWVHPETAVSTRAPNPEDVTRWAVILRRPGAPIAIRRKTREPYG